MIDSNSIDRLTGATVFDVDGDKIGKIGQVYVDPDTQAPLWASVTTGLFGTSESFVPLDDANVQGEDVRVAYQKQFVKDAPRVESDGALNDTETDTLYTYYSRGGAETSGTGYDTTSTTTGRDTTQGHDTSGVNADDAITRSEEQLHVGTERREAGRARLRKYVTTEQQTVTVPVTHEEVHVVREPITDANVGDALDGPAISEEEHEVTLHAEHAVVEKDVVPVERIKLGTETVTEDQQVTENVRKEQVEIDGDNTTGLVEPDTRR